MAMNGEDAMSDTLRALVDLLSQDLPVERILARVGPVARDPGAPMPLELRPKLPGVRAAKLARYPESEVPYALDLELDKDWGLTAAALKRMFGGYNQALTGRGQPRELLFYPPAGNAPWRVVLIAQLAPEGDSLDASHISAITLRRDAATGGAP
jgi:hypothetical protein